jgi:hypothetical protein
MVILNNLKQLGRILLPVNLRKPGAFQYTRIDQHSERVPALDGAVLFWITGHDQPAAMLPRERLRPGCLILQLTPNLAT